MAEDCLDCKQPAHGPVCFCHHPQRLHCRQGMGGGAVFVGGTAVKEEVVCPEVGTQVRPESSRLEQRARVRDEALSI